MAELLIELLTEEIPARMQARAAEDLCRLTAAALAPLMTVAPQGFHGPRRIGLVGEMALSAETPAKEERGPRLGAPEQALAGFLKKHNATREQLVEQNGFLVLVKPGETITAEALLARALPDLLWSFPWPKSMRWGMSQLTWVRPLQRVLCLLDGRSVPVTLARGEDSAHGLVGAAISEGHRVHAPGPFPVTSAAGHEAELRERFVLRDAAARMAVIREGITALAAAEGLEVVPDEGLLAEVAGLVEWPVPLLGRIDDAFMDLPPEVMRTSMRVNQRYFALRHPDGRAAPRFALVANIAASDGGAALVAGNERVLRARLSDARFFWDQDRKQRLEDFLPKLEGVTFHAKLGTQRQRVDRLVRLAGHIAPLVGADTELAQRAALLCKADLASGMVGEFPELQGVMGGYYARAQGEDARVADAIAQHYRPLGPTDAVPTEPVAVAVALADKLDQLAGFFAVDERPTGSGDPYALRRAALGVIRIVRENNLRVGTQSLLQLHADTLLGTLASIGATHVREAQAQFEAQLGMALRERWTKAAGLKWEDLLAVHDFLLDRLRVQLRAEGARHDLVAASIGSDDDITRILSRAAALQSLMDTEAGKNLLAAYKRAQNILRIEDKKDGPHQGPVDEAALEASEERALNAALIQAEGAVKAALAAENFPAAMAALAALRAPTDDFFEKTLVNDPAFRKNRLRLLSRLRSAMDRVADLSKIEAQGNMSA
ncbi:glycine--tRNA ligase subunit beta [Roseococcus suduntuyensis]|uniref:Glycine--tRNA ligase beta subunit n=1 Tax=Roseococcus suduntuyensis TaxID=455361 RepID=A0A840ADG9_9PROT|nr:glycine--tRNA ligase subunit beta [Roseococcus suduntuyensis]MBB3898962.1 glycyl-tRNA synthetase beta chain [Roseococcus suduntuyensis]